MPCLLITDVHEGTNEISTVPTRGVVNPPPGEQSGDSCREEKTPRALLQDLAVVLVQVHRVARSRYAKNLGS